MVETKTFVLSVISCQGSSTVQIPLNADSTREQILKEIARFREDALQAHTENCKNPNGPTGCLVYINPDVFDETITPNSSNFQND